LSVGFANGSPLRVIVPSITAEAVVPLSEGDILSQKNPNSTKMKSAENKAK
jgi:hypothetical protein